MDKKSIRQILSDSKNAIKQLLDTAGLAPGTLVVVGCSTSEVGGSRIGTASVKETADAIIQGICPVLEENGMFLAAQCCEHLNRALIIESGVAEARGYEPVSVVPQIKAGGAFSTGVYERMKAPVAVESVMADAGMDIGDTLIGMHIRPIAVPVRIQVARIGRAHVTAARYRPKLIGGKRSIYPG